MKFLSVLILLVSFSAMAEYKDYTCDSESSTMTLEGRKSGGVSQFYFQDKFEIPDTRVKASLDSLKSGDEEYIILTLTLDGKKLSEVKASMNQEISLRVPLMNSAKEVYGFAETTCAVKHAKASVAVNESGREEIKDVSVNRSPAITSSSIVSNE